MLGLVNAFENRICSSSFKRKGCVKGVNSSQRHLVAEEGEGRLSSHQQLPEHTPARAARELLSAVIREEMNPRSIEWAPNCCLLQAASVRTRTSKKDTPCPASLPMGLSSESESGLSLYGQIPNPEEPRL